MSAIPDGDYGEGMPINALSEHSKRRKFTDREFSTVLAALRYWQRNLEQGNVGEDDEFEPIASNAGALEPLDAEEIDLLCEQLNEGGLVHEGY